MLIVCYLKVLIYVFIHAQIRVLYSRVRVLELTEPFLLS